MVATVLWDYGEDALSDLVLDMSDDGFDLVKRVAATFEDPSYPLPMNGQRISGGHVIAFAVVTCVEGLRPLARTRRRRTRSVRHTCRSGIDRG